MAHHLTIGAVARATGVAAKTIRYYEGIGVLPIPDRTASGYRQYDDSAVERLRFIGRARSLGLPLQRLRLLTSALNGKPRAALRPRLLRLVQEQLSAVRQQIADLGVLREQLEGVSRRLLHSAQRGETGACRCLEPVAAPGHSRKPRAR
jgi:DNA-binding transcriptional MerR regulator